MIEIYRTAEFAVWLDGIRDSLAAKKITQRIARVRAGLFGDVKYFSGIGELRIDYGPGYRVYFVRKGNLVVILLCGGDKSSQQRDIVRAQVLAKEF